MESVGQRIALYRNLRRWGQEKLAAEIGVTQAKISEIENNKISPKWDIIMRIADKLQVSVLSLLPLDNNTINPFLESTDKSINHGNTASQPEQRLIEALHKSQEELLATKDKLIKLLEQKYTQ